MSVHRQAPGSLSIGISGNLSYPNRHPVRKRRGSRILRLMQAENASILRRRVLACTAGWLVGLSPAARIDQLRRGRAKLGIGTGAAILRMRPPWSSPSAIK